MASTPVQRRVQKHREGLRRAGLRPVQIWVPDTRSAGFMEEAARQCLLASEADRADAGVQEFMDESLADLDGWKE